MKVVTKQAASFIWFQGMLAAERQTSFLPDIEEDLILPLPSLREALQPVQELNCAAAKNGYASESHLHWRIS